MARLDFCELASASADTADSDQFEKFAKIFMEKILGGIVTKGPSRGADGGIDIRVEFDIAGCRIAKLVSCKHYAPSKKSVGRSDEEDIQDRLAEFECDEFVGFYSTIASSALEQKLERLKAKKGILYQIYNSEDIETLLLENHAGFQLAKRFFPRSVQNILPQFIALLPTFTSCDAVRHSSGWIVPDVYSDYEPRVYACNANLAAQYANEKAMNDIHEPMFLQAWKDAVHMFSDYFIIPAAGINSVSNINELPPDWDTSDDIINLSAGKRWALLAIWSFFDYKKVNAILKKMHKHPSQQDLNVISFAFLAMITGTERRDVLARLFAYATPFRSW